MNWMNKTLNYITGKTLKDIIIKNIKLEEKLLEKQEHINRTNAYWKKKIYGARDS